MERMSDKQLKASKSLEANRKYRQNMRDKISLVQKDDTRLDELLDRIKLIQKRLDGIMSDSDSNSDTESEPDQIEPVKKLVNKKVGEPKKMEVKAEPKKEVKKSEMKAEPKAEEKTVQPAESKYIHQYSAFV
jgi:outer membrane biosynthesis protein TonB